MPDGSLDLVPVWTATIALGIFLYVLLDGFDLGVGMLYAFAPTAERRTVMHVIAPVWDGNETWLVLGGVALFSARSFKGSACTAVVSSARSGIG
jgi:cytochrome d ubiquinol oxidase subunit II